MRYLDNALTLGGTLNKEERRRRYLFFAISVALLAVSGLGVGVHAGGVLTYWVACLIGTITSAAGVILVLSGFKVTTMVIVTTAYIYGVTCLFADFAARSLHEAFWGALVLVVDFLLVMQVDAKYCVVLVSCTVVYLIVVWTEERWRWGMFNAPWLPSAEERREEFERRFDCENQPCPHSSWQALITPLQVFVTDFIATRGFAREVLKEQSSMESTIKAVQDIASLLAGYDVEGVAELLEAQRVQLPEEMHATLQTLEENLRKYRPYLPAALFEEDDSEALRVSMTAPGVASETATIVFTDIRASTSIWENAPDGMRAGLKIHNRVMREVMALFGGYEVKTIGDAFMIAFETTADGINFALQVHEKLLAADWPASLLEVPICAPQDSLWGGLTVRIGVNTGPVTLEQNALTGRTDYFGHTVNVAARLESACKPGAVAVRSDVYRSDCAACNGVVGETEALELKGVSGLAMVCPVWPAPLERRGKCPLREPAAESVESYRLRTMSLHSGLSLMSAHPTPSRQVLGTVGVGNIAVEDEHSTTLLDELNTGLATLSASLEQSRGSLVTLLGSRVCVSWNVTRSAPAHMENAVRFAQRMLAKCILSSIGLASGLIQHGDVGARRQRFVTVMGETVRRSWTLCEEAVREDVMCLFEPPEGTALPTSLQQVLSAYAVRQGVYKAANIGPMYSD